MKTRYFAFFAMFLVPTIAPAKDSSCENPPQTTPFVDLTKYVGTWYEISAIPQRFQKGCQSTRATYSQLPNGRIGVLNECIRDGKWTDAQGQAEVVDTETNAKLEVSFVWPYFWFKGDYWILDISPTYDYALVGNACRTTGWILSRTKTMSAEELAKAEAKFKSLGYDLNQFVRTVQNDN